MYKFYTPFSHWAHRQTCHSIRPHCFQATHPEPIQSVSGINNHQVSRPSVIPSRAGTVKRYSGPKTVCQLMIDSLSGPSQTPIGPKVLGSSTHQFRLSLSVSWVRKANWVVFCHVNGTCGEPGRVYFIRQAKKTHWSRVSCNLRKNIALSRDDDNMSINDSISLLDMVSIQIWIKNLSRSFSKTWDNLFVPRLRHRNIKFHSLGTLHTGILLSTRRAYHFRPKGEPRLRP
jgi:hypothetical protein